MNDSFKRAEDWLRSQIERVSQHLMPGGKKIGREWRAASTDGGDGKSAYVIIEGPKLGMWGDFAGDEKNGSVINLWRLKNGIQKDDHDALFRSLHAFGMPDVGWQFNDEHRSAPSHAPIDWQCCVQALDVEKLAEYRGWPLEFCEWLKDNSRIGWSRVGYGGEAFAWPIHAKGKVVAVHRFVPGNKDATRVKPEGLPLSPLIWGDLKEATEAHVFESQWDMGSVCILSADQEWHKDPDKIFVCTRGPHVSKLSRLLPKSIDVWAWPQNDPPEKKDRDGFTPSDKWLRAVLKVMADEGRKVSVVRLRDHVDHNEWLYSLSGGYDPDPDELLEEVQRIMVAAEVVDPPKVEPPKVAEQEPSEMPSDIAAKVKMVSEEYGPSAIYNRDGKISNINQRWWGKWYSLAHPNLRFDLEEGAFYQYTQETGLFTKLADKAVGEGIAQEISIASRTWGDGWEALFKCNTNRTLSDVRCLLGGIIGRNGVFSQKGKDHFIHVANGMIIFNEDIPEDPVILKHFSPEYLSRNRSEVEYNPNAQCPEFKDRILGHLDVSDRLLLQKYGGQCLIGRNLSHRFLLLEGVGGSSKSAFVRILSAIIGQDNIQSLRTHLLTDRFEIGRMIGKTLLVGSDVRGDFLSHPGAQVIKSLTGDDRIHAELKGSNSRFELYGNFNAAITCNESLRIAIREDREAWARRLLIIHYHEAFKGQRIPEIHNELVKGSIFASVWDKSRHVVPSFPIPTSWGLWRGADDGLAAPACVLWGAHDKTQNRIYVVSELFKSGMLPDEMARRVVERDRSLLVNEYGNTREHGKELEGLIDASAFDDPGNGSLSRGQIMNKMGCGWKKAQVAGSPAFNRS